jgi:hypothetical protein
MVLMAGGAVASYVAASRIGLPLLTALARRRSRG